MSLYLPTHLIQLEKHPIVPWISDINASYHIVFTPCLYSSNATYISSTIVLPNGDNVSHIRTLKISDTLVLDNVLCVSCFNSNIISSRYWLRI